MQTNIKVQRQKIKALNKFKKQSHEFKYIRIKMKGSKRSKLATEHETINMQPTKKKVKI